MSCCKLCCAAAVVQKSDWVYDRLDAIHTEAFKHYQAEKEADTRLRKSAFGMLDGKGVVAHKQKVRD